MEPATICFERIYAGVRFILHNFTSGSTIQIKLYNIHINRSFSLSEVYVSVRFFDLVTSKNIQEIEYKATFSVMYKTIFGTTFSAASLHKETTYPHTFYRKEVTPLFTNALIAGLAILFVWEIIALIKPRSFRYFPFFSLMLILVTIYLYVFVGSSYEVRNEWELIPFLSVFFHGFDNHIKYNLLYFSIVSFLFETWLDLKNDKNLLFLYLLFLFIPGCCGFGLSGSIETLTFLLWGYIIRNYRYLIKSGRDVIFCILSGISAKGFVEWAFDYLLEFSSYDPYYTDLALRHIFCGIFSGIIVLLLLLKFPNVLKLYWNVKNQKQ